MTIREFEINQSISNILKKKTVLKQPQQRATKNILRDILDKSVAAPCSTSLEDHNIKFNEVSGLLEELITAVRSESDQSMN